MFARFEGTVRGLPLRAKYAQADLLIPELLVEREGRLSMYYAPFDWLNRDARIILLGITPGWTQMELAYRVARAAIDTGAGPDAICREAKQHGAFAGSMRSNLVRMLDAIGIPAALGITSAADLFSAARSLLHTSSTIRYPVFVNARNYTGSPSPVQSAMLMRYARTVLAPELAAVPDAIIIPLGQSVERVLRALSDEGYVDAARWLSGFPHPSGANGHRARLFAAHRESLMRQVDGRLGIASRAS